MGRNGKVNTRDLKEFRQKLASTLDDKKVNSFLEACAKELAARLLSLVIKATPVGQYPKGTGKVGGTLRRGWTGGKNQAGIAYANSLKVHHFGDAYVIEIVNPVEYASYVEFGHRTRGGDGWVNGKKMLTLSEDEIKNKAPRILENKLKKKLGECFK